MITCARTVALLSRQRADGGDLIGITRMPATGTSALVVPSLARQGRAREQHDRPEKNAQSKYPAKRNTHGCLVSAGTRVRACPRWFGIKTTLASSVPPRA